MKFVCDKCGTGYTIPDHKVIGRILKIRCTQCREVVEVMGPPPPQSALALEPGLLGAPGQTAVERTPAAVLAAPGHLEHRLAGVHLPRQVSDIRQRLDPETEAMSTEQWFAVIKGRRVGPLSRDEILVCARRGTIHERSYVWRPGMPAWRRIGEDPGLAFLETALGKRQMLQSADRVRAALQHGVFARMLAPDPVHEQPTQPPTSARTVAALEHSDWFVLDAQQQAVLWDVPPLELAAGDMRLMTGTHALPGKRPLRTALLLLALALAFAVGVLSLAWQQRSWLVYATAPLASAVSDVAESTPARALVEQVRAALDPNRGYGVRWPELAQPAPRPRATRRPAVNALHLDATPVPTYDLSGAAKAPTEREPLRQANVVQLPNAEAVDTWVVQQLRPPSLDLGEPVAAAAPESTTPIDLTAEDVVRVMATRRPQLEAVYTSVLKHHPELAGTVEATIIINRQGRVGGVVVSGESEAARELATRMQETMRRWTFPRPTTELEVVVPIRLNQVQ